MAEKGVWWSLQPFLDDSPSPFPEGSANRRKQLELLALSGLRSPYEGKLGVAEAGALADLLLVDGDPIADIDLISDPANNFVVIMKDGRIYKNTVGGRN